VFVTVFLTKLSVAVCEEVVEAVVVIVCVLEPTEDLERLGEADWVLEIELDEETVEVLRWVHVITGVCVPEILAVDVFETEVEPERVAELVCVFEVIELNEYVGV
jgi:hypothetical protein